MPKIISIVPEVEIIFSLPRGKIIQNKSIIYLLAQYIGATVSIEKINNAQEFSVAAEMENLVIIINHDDVIFFAEQDYEKIYRLN
ncbi:hypothetical protein [Rosenbergiella metrosideri]|uniref:hypothetical protein n=1 Tax=Rosenbergiella metrosideri TaxID=2921185 RepID=UPI001F4FD50C|nr:hypothetical protein [Rosenbergiella metrosideri]